MVTAGRRLPRAARRRAAARRRTAGSATARSQQVRDADVTVALVGEHPSRSGEDQLVSDLGLPAGQLDVLEQLAALGKPLVVVVYTGRPLELGAVLELADAVVVAWHPGVEAGPALPTCCSGRPARAAGCR